MINNSPSSDQIYNAKLMGWEYLGEGLFANKNDDMGWYIVTGGWETE